MNTFIDELYNIFVTVVLCCVSDPLMIGLVWQVVFVAGYLHRVPTRLFISLLEVGVRFIVVGKRCLLLRHISCNYFGGSVCLCCF